MATQYRQHGPWKILESREVYRDPWTRLRRDEVIRPDGEPGSYSVLDLKPGVSVLAIDEQDNAYLTEEFHYGVGRVTIEAVSGGIEAGDDLSGLESVSDPHQPLRHPAAYAEGEIDLDLALDSPGQFHRLTGTAFVDRDGAHRSRRGLDCLLLRIATNQYERQRDSEPGEGSSYCHFRCHEALEGSLRTGE